MGVGKMNSDDRKSTAFEHRKKTIRIGRFTLEHWQIVSALLIVYGYLAVVGAYFFAL